MLLPTKVKNDEASTLHAYKQIYYPAFFRMCNFLR